MPLGALTPPLGALTVPLGVSLAACAGCYRGGVEGLQEGLPRTAVVLQPSAPIYVPSLALALAGQRCRWPAALLPRGRVVLL